MTLLEQALDEILGLHRDSACGIIERNDVEHFRGGLEGEVPDQKTNIRHIRRFVRRATEPAAMHFMASKYSGTGIVNRR